MSSIAVENQNNIRNPMNVLIDIYPPTGEVISIRNDTLIRCVVTLRGDLSTDNPTLPESEIEIEAYYKNDISDLVASMPNDMEIQYSAGYSDTATTIWNMLSMSKVRYFYTDEPITWKDGILHIHGVDQVHKLDEAVAPLYLGFAYGGNPSRSQHGGLKCIARAFFDVVFGQAKAGISSQGVEKSAIKHLQVGLLPNYAEGDYSTEGSVNAILDRGTRREIIAKLMNITHIDIPPGFIGNVSTFWPTYVDAGCPYCRIQKTQPGPIVSIREADCGDIVIEHERTVSKYVYRVRDVLQLGAAAVKLQNSATVFKQNGVDISYDEYEDRNFVMYPHNGTDYIFFSLDFNTDMQKRSRPYSDEWEFTRAFFDNNKYGMWLFDDEVNDNVFNPGGYSFFDLKSSWSSGGYSTYWNNMISDGTIEADAISTTLERVGYGFKVTDEKLLTIDTGNSGVVKEITSPIFNGDIYVAKLGETVPSFNDVNSLHVLPEEGLKALAKRSRTTGSFTWKGDPRMQPRDKFRFIRLEYNLLDENEVQLMTENSEDIIVGGNTQECTIETITLTHEGGGLISQITYREGIC